MKRIATVVTCAALVMLSASGASAQKGTVFLVGSAGASLPMGDFKDGGAKTGYMASAGLGYDVTNHLFIAGLGRYGSNGSDAGGESQKLTGFGATAGWSFGTPTSKIAPYIRGGVSMLKGKVGDISGDSKSTMHGAFGLFMPKAKGGWFVEGEYNTNDDIDFLVVSVGLTWTIKAGS